MNKKLGFSLIEILLAITISIIIIASSLFVYKKVKINNQATSIVQEMSSIKAQSTELFKTMGNSNSLKNFINNNCSVDYSGVNQLNDTYKKLKTQCYDKLGINTQIRTDMGNVYITLVSNIYNIDNPAVAVYGVQDPDLCIAIVKKLFPMTSYNNNDNSLNYFYTHDSLYIGNESSFYNLFRSPTYSKSVNVAIFGAACKDFSDNKKTSNFIKFGPIT